MNQLLMFVIVMVVLAGPVRIAAYLFNAEHGTWLRSIAVLMLGALLVNFAFAMLPGSLTSTEFLRFAITFCILTVVSTVLLYVKVWQGAVLAAVLSVLYSFGGGAVGTMAISANVGI